MHIAFDVLADAIKDTLYIIPFLFVTYLAMEWLEHKTGGKAEAAIQRAGAAGPFIGAVVGVVPQCGFSAAAATLWAGRVITLGTLFAVFLSTSVSYTHLDVYKRQVVNRFQQGRNSTVPAEEAPANYVPAAAVIRRERALSGFIGRKERVGGLSSGISNPRAQPPAGSRTGRLEFGRGRRNSRCSGGMRRYREEHRWRRQPAGPQLTLRRES